jgi:methyltransferase (TIGR00027 family)
MIWLFRKRRPGRGSAPSRTSQAVALTRAEFDRPHSPGGDPDAQRRLCRGMRTTVTGRLRASLAARTGFFDEQVLAAISAGVSQVVIVGAGYDDRALRFRSPGVRFFELDHPGTQADKAARLRVMGAGAGVGGPVLAAADFRRDDVAAVLAASGHDARRPSLFVCEGLLVYLDQPTCVQLLGALRERAAAGSRLAASLSVHRDGLDSERVAAVANARRRAAEAEPWLTILPAAAHLDLLRRAGWRAAESVDAAELGAGAEPGRSLLVTAAPEPAGGV